MKYDTKLTNENSSVFIVRQVDVIHVVRQDSILYCKSDKGYSQIHTVDSEKIMVTRTLSYLQKQLNDNFVNISQSYSVNLDYIKKIDKKRKLVILTNGIELPYTISPTLMLDRLDVYSQK